MNDLYLERMVRMRQADLLAEADRPHPPPPLRVGAARGHCLKRSPRWVPGAKGLKGAHLAGGHRTSRRQRGKEHHQMRTTIVDERARVRRMLLLLIAAWDLLLVSCFPTFTSISGKAR